MNKFAIILVCMIICFTMLSGCDENDAGNNRNLDNSVEIDDTGVGDVDIEYEFKDPENSDGIVVVPKE